MLGIKHAHVQGPPWQLPLTGGGQGQPRLKARLSAPELLWDLGSAPTPPGLPFPHCRVWQVSGGALLPRVERPVRQLRGSYRQRSHLIRGAMCQPVSEPAGIRWAWGAQIFSAGEVRAEQGLRGPPCRRQSAGSQLPTSTTALHLVLRSRGDPARDALTPPQAGPRPSLGVHTGAGSQVGCSSDLIPTSWAEWLHPRWFSDQAQAPGPISQTCFPRLLSRPLVPGTFSALEQSRGPAWSGCPQIRP